MLRILPVPRRFFHQKQFIIRQYSSSKFIRSTFIDFFKTEHEHKVISSSSVVPLCDPTVPFVNAGMNQFKGVFLGTIQPPCLRAVNSQKCVRVGGKHNDLDVVGNDGHHHTFFEMLGSWSFGDYYKKEACQMAWDLLLGPYRLKPHNLVVTYFGGDAVMGLPEDRECRDIWKQIGVPSNRIKPMDAKDNFWEMGATGPCGPCTEIHHINADGTLTEIWNLVFIQCNRESDGSLKPLSTCHVDTGMGLERMTALLNGTPSNYDTDLFQPIIKAIEKESKNVDPYSGKFGPNAILDTAYRRLADHARMVSICLADSCYPANNLNLKQVLRKSFRLSSDVFNSDPGMLTRLYDVVSESLSSTYPELERNSRDAKLIIQYEEESFKKLRKDLTKKWKDLVKMYPEVESLSDVENAGFALGYKKFKEAMAKHKSKVVPGDEVFKLYDTHGFQLDLIERIAKLNNLKIDKKSFENHLTEHKNRHKTAFKEQADKKTNIFEDAIKIIIENGAQKTNDLPKYDYKIHKDEIVFEPLETNLLAILNEEGDWIDFSEPSDSTYYLVTKDTNFYCEEGGQTFDLGVIEVNSNLKFNVQTVFKIKDFVFHKGNFTKVNFLEDDYVSSTSDVVLRINSERRAKVMCNHSAVHLLNAAVRKVLKNSVVCQNGSSVTDKGLSLSLSVYGEKISEQATLDIEDLVRQVITSNVPIETVTVDNVQLASVPSVLTVPGERYPERGLRLVTAQHGDLLSRELCCGTHVPSTGLIQEFCLTSVKSVGSNMPVLSAITGEAAKEVRELYCRATKLSHVSHLADGSRLLQEGATLRAGLAALGGAPAAGHAAALRTVAALEEGAGGQGQNLQELANAEIMELVTQAISEGRKFTVHFLRCSYLMAGNPGGAALRAAPSHPALLLGCANGVIHATASVPVEHQTATFTAARWLACVLPVFRAEMMSEDGQDSDTVAEMTGTKVSLITCEQLVQDAMRAAIKYAKAHTETVPTSADELGSKPDESDSKTDDSDSEGGRKDRRRN